MPSIISVTSDSDAPSIVVVREVYKKVFANTALEFNLSTNFDAMAVGCMVTIEPNVALVTDPVVDNWRRFQTLVEQWKVQRGAMSSIVESVLCPAYQSIIGMGLIAVPLILEQLEMEGDDPDQWFWALRAITGFDPVPNQDRGNYFRMAAAWIAWGRLKGYAW